MLGLEDQRESGDAQLTAVPEGTIVLIGQEFHTDLDWWKMDSARTMFGSQGVVVFTLFFPNAMGSGTALDTGCYFTCCWRFMRRDRRSVVGVRLNPFRTPVPFRGQTT